MESKAALSQREPKTRSTAGAKTVAKFGESVLPFSFVMADPFRLDLSQRPRRLRRTASLRALVQETVLRPADFIAPLFVVEGKAAPEEISSMPGVFRFGIADLVKECRALQKLGVPAVALFPKLDSKLKDDEGTQALNE